MDSVKQFNIQVILEKKGEAEMKIFLWYDIEDAKREASNQWYQVISEDKDIKVIEYWSDNKPFFYSKKITKKDILLFFELFWNLEGLPPTKQIEILKKQSKKYIMKLFYDDILNYISKWKSLHYILELPKWSKFFSHNQLELIKVWEQTKNLNETIVNLWDEQKNEIEIKAQIVTAAAYPIIVMFLLIVCSLVLFIFILPTMMSITWWMELPYLTQVLFDIRSFILDYWVISFILFLIIVWALFVLTKGYNGKLMLHKFLLICPWLKWLTKARVEMQISKILEFSSKAQMNPSVKVDLLKNWVNNLFYKEYFESKANSIKLGWKLFWVFLDDKLFSPEIQWYVEVGDHNKTLDKLMKMHYSTILGKIQNNIQLVKTLLNAITILFLWGIVLLFAGWIFQLVIWLTDSVL